MWKAVLSMYSPLGSLVTVLMEDVDRAGEGDANYEDGIVTGLPLLKILFILLNSGT